MIAGNTGPGIVFEDALVNNNTVSGNDIGRRLSVSILTVGKASPSTAARIRTPSAARVPAPPTSLTITWATESPWGPTRAIRPPPATRFWGTCSSRIRVLGIDLGNEGPTVNDSAGHAGPNHFQNYPVVTAYNSSTMTVSGTFHEDGEIGKRAADRVLRRDSLYSSGQHVRRLDERHDGRQRGRELHRRRPLERAPRHRPGVNRHGDGHDAGDTSELSPVFVVTTTTTTLQASPSPFKSGQPINLLATVAVPTGGNPSGSVEFKDETMSFGSAPVVDGQASKSITLPEGQYNITAIYTSDNSLPGSSSDPLPLTSMPRTRIRRRSRRRPRSRRPGNTRGSCSRARSAIPRGRLYRAATFNS